MINVFGCLTGAEELEEIKSSMDAQWMGMGPKVEKFEKLMSGKIGLDFVAVDNCSNALYMALKILDLPKGSEVIVPAITWISCANAVIVAGLTPIFADCDYDTINVTDETITEVITKRTKAIMIVHYAGLPTEINATLPVIADCAHAIDTYNSGYHIAKLSDISVFSFDPIKNIATCELGGITALNPAYTSKARSLRYCGVLKSGYQASSDKNRWWEYEVGAPFIKMLPNDISASIAIAQFEKLSRLQSKRKAIWDTYQQQFKDLDWCLTPPPIPEYVQHSYFTYYLRILNGKRDELAKFLLDNGIYTTVRYQPLHLIKSYQCQQKLPVAELLNEQLINLPLHPSITSEQLVYIVGKVVQFGKGK
uniref:Putative DegT/DnrJ/EryC1/StrS aminotransferase family protein n=1 Tax=viral metagenome TaxID=1070528 RepID=A0A6H1ZD69_9ZZZZ